MLYEMIDAVGATRDAWLAIIGPMTSELPIEFSATLSKAEHKGAWTASTGIGPPRSSGREGS